MDKRDLTTIKISKTTRRLAKILAAYKNISLADLVHSLVVKEIEKEGLNIERDDIGRGQDGR